MGFRRILAPCYGIGAYGQNAYQQASKFRVYQFPPDIGLAKIQVFSPTRVFLGDLGLDIKEVPVASYEFHYGAEGGIDFNLELNEEPDFPIVRFAEVVFWIGDVRVFRGYVFKYPGPEKKVGESWKYSGHGMGKRLEKRKIALKVGINIYNIDAISISGNTVTVTTQDPLGYTEEEALYNVCIVSNAENSDNDGRFEISDVGTNYVKFLNPAGENQSLNIGLLTILPREWSDPTTRISTLIAQVISEYMDNIPISRVPTLIETSPQAVTGDVVDLDGMALDEFFKLMREVAPEFYLYVDAQSRIVFREKEERIVAVAIIGYDGFEQANEIRNDNDVVNRWFVNRKAGKEEVKAGFKNGGFAQDDTSIAEIGLLESDKDVPVYFGNALCDALAEALLEDSKDPKTTIQVTGVPFAYYPIGLWKVITLPRRRNSIIYNGDTLTGWNYNSELITLSIDSQEKLFGAGSLKASYDVTANGKAFTFDLNLVLIDPVKLTFFYKPGKIGQRLIFGYGETSYTENEEEVYGYSLQWRPKIIDLSQFQGSKIGQIGFRVEYDDSYVEQSTAAVGIGQPGYPFAWPFGAAASDVFRIDQIVVDSTSSEHKIIELVDVKLKNKQEDQSGDLVYGKRYIGLDGELAGVSRSLKTQRLALRESS